MSADQYKKNELVKYGKTMQRWADGKTTWITALALIHITATRHHLGEQWEMEQREYWRPQFKRPEKKLSPKSDRSSSKPSQKSDSKRGRPRQYDENKVNQTHRMTPAAHKFIEGNREMIEKMARSHFELQYKIH